MDVATWQRRLEDTFLNGDGAHRAFLEVLGAEAEFARQALEQTRGHFSLAHSLQAFILETFAESASHVGSPALKGRQCHSLFLFEIVLAFRTIRACENVFLSGYPHTGYALLRGLRDRVLFLVANGLGITSFHKLWGLRPNMTAEEIEAERDDIRKRAEAEEKRVLNAVLRKTTDLGTHLDALLRWDRMFNPEVHGDKYSGSHLFMSWYRDGRGLPVYPEYDIEFGSVYLNRAGDLGWMLLRLLPLLQPEPSAFSSAWAGRWAILDDSFLVYNRGLIKIGKPGLTEIAEGIKALIDVRFAFGPDSSSYQSCLE